MHQLNLKSGCQERNTWKQIHHNLLQDLRLHGKSPHCVIDQICSFISQCMSSCMCPHHKYPHYAVIVQATTAWGVQHRYNKIHRECVFALWLASMLLPGRHHVILEQKQSLVLTQYWCIVDIFNKIRWYHLRCGNK